MTIEVDEVAVPLGDGVEAACELWGLDPLHLANEGVLAAMVPPEAAEAVLQAMRAHPAGHSACAIGRVGEGRARVVVNTAVGGSRVVAVPTGALLPRIC